MTTWTKEPPKEPGDYHFRSAVDHSARSIAYLDCSLVDASDWQMWPNDATCTTCHPYQHPNGTIEWWPIPIQPPPTEQENEQ